MIKEQNPVLVSAGDTSRPYRKILVSDYHFITSDGIQWKIDAGFATDIASVPRGLLKRIALFLFTINFIFCFYDFYVSAISFFFACLILAGLFYSERALTDEAAFVEHDWFYKNKRFIRYSRKTVDKEMAFKMKKKGASYRRIFVMYNAVRLAGWFYWNDIDDKIGFGKI